MIDSVQTAQIREFLVREKFTDIDLIDDLVDHISCEIELRLETNSLTFQEAFEQAKEKALPDNPVQVEQDLKILTTKNSNIMFKKISYVGGYISALVFSLAILFTVLSFQNEAITDSRRESTLRQYILSDIDHEVSPEERTDIFRSYNKETALLNLKAIKQRSTSQTLLIVSMLLFGITYLPYRFYTGFKKGELALT